MVTREVINDRPIAVTFQLSDFGCLTLCILERLKDWSEDHEEDNSKAATEG